MTQYHPAFFTATVLEWKHLLRPDKYKKVIVDSLNYLVSNGRVDVYAFVIMNNHLHLIWQVQKGSPAEVQRDFMKFTAQSIKKDLEKHHPDVLRRFEVGAKDRKYQIWKGNSSSVELINKKAFLQKMQYIHSNPVKAGLCGSDEDYWYSSARFYETGIDDFGIFKTLEE
jgi:putative transposase